ncbi:MAG: hypothetical protein JST00_01455 [Deltaproteobacteria bacterium]|nr:hypothetical protein [Deltaproteobacteria bacterium]
MKRAVGQGLWSLAIVVGLVSAPACDGAPANVEPAGTSTSSGGTSGSSGTAIDGGSTVTDASGSDGSVTAPPPVPSGCITDVTPGVHDFTCEGLATKVSIPDACTKPGCGLITEIHGDTGTGALMDAHTNLIALGKGKGFVVVAPSGRPWPGGPGNTWAPDDDEKVVRIIQKVAEVFRTDPKRNHLTGFSRGGFVVWRLLCKHADLWASVAPATAGSGPGGGCNGVAEVSCPFDASQANGMPKAEVPIVFLVGRTDTPVPYGCTSRIRDQAIAAWGLSTKATVASDAKYTHQRWSNAKGTVLETFEHSYETEPTGPWGSSKGHCFPGSTMDPFAPQYAVPCKLPNAFTWGVEVMKFFEAHPKK